MQKLFGTITLAVAFLWLSTTIARADRVPDLTRFLDTEISTMSRAAESAPGAPMEKSGMDDYSFKQFLIRVQALIGITVPWTMKVQVVPEVELLWQK